MLERLRPLCGVAAGLTHPKMSAFKRARVQVAAGHGSAEANARMRSTSFIALRNSEHGLAVLTEWSVRPERPDRRAERPTSPGFDGRTGDLYIAARDLGFWQGALRDRVGPAYSRSHRPAINDRTTFTIDLLYGDGKAVQRVISRLRSSQEGRLVR